MGNSSKATTFDDILITSYNPDILSSNDWNAFVRNRREKLRNMIENVCGGVFQPFTDSMDMEISPVEEDEYGDSSPRQNIL